MIKDRITIDSFLLADKKLSGKEFSITFAVAGISLASNIAFFVSAHREYGCLLGIGPLFYCAMQFLLLYLINYIPINFNSVHSIADLWSKICVGSTITRCIVILSAVSCLTGTLTELFVGAEIFSIFLPNTAFYKAATFFTLGLMVVAFVRYGGYKAVIKTDPIEFLIMFVAGIVLIYFVLSATNVSHATVGQMSLGLFAHNQHGISLLVFLLWDCSLNICAALTDAVMWQRMAALASPKEGLRVFVRSGIWRWSIILLSPLLCIVLLHLKGNTYNSMPQFLEVLRSESWLTYYVVFPITLVGFATAFFSTAYTKIIGALYSLCYQSDCIAKLEKLDMRTQKRLIRKYIDIFSIACIVLFFVISIFYCLERQKLSEYIMPIMYAVWGQISILAPLIIYALYRIKTKKHHIKFTKVQNYILLAFLIIGWVIVLLGSLTRTNMYAQLSFLVATFVVCLGLYVSTSFAPRHSHVLISQSLG